MKELLASSRISYVGVSEELLDDYLAMVNDPEVGSLIGIEGPVGEAWERNWVKGKVEEKAPLFSMIEKETGTFIGNIELMDPTADCAELGISIVREKQNKGYGKEAIRTILDYAKRRGMTRVFLKVYPQNARAIRVYSECGFKEYDRTEKQIFMEIFF